MNNTTQTSSRAGVPSLEVFAQWDFRAIFRVFANVSGLILNSLVVYFIFKDRTKTSFKIYICNLCCVNLYYTLSYINQLITVWHRFPGAPPPAFCFFYRFVTTTSVAFVNQAHFLIAMNRVWAVMWPISYRQYNAQNFLRNSWLICAASWMYVLIWSLPGLILGELATRNPPEMLRCSFNVLGPRSWSIPLQFIEQDLTIVMTCLMYPLVLYKTLGRAVQKHGNRVENEPTAASKTVTSRTGAPSDMVELTSKTSENGDTTRELVVLQPESSPKREGRSWLADTMEKLRHGHFLTVSMLSLNATVCLLPGPVYFTLLYFDVQVPAQAVAVITTLYSLSQPFDPILLLLTMKPLRQSFKELFIRKKT